MFALSGEQVVMGFAVHNPTDTRYLRRRVHVAVLPQTCADKVRVTYSPYIQLPSKCQHVRCCHIFVLQTNVIMRYHICVCGLEVAKINFAIARPCFRDVLLSEGERITSQEDHAAIRLQRVLSAARQASQAIAKRAWVDTALHGRGSRLSPDPGPTERKGRRHIDADLTSFCRGVSATARNARSWPRHSCSSSRAAPKDVKEIAALFKAEDTVSGVTVRTSVRFGIYYLSEVSAGVCDTLFRPFAETFE